MASLYIRRLQNLFLLLAVVVSAAGCTRELEKSTASTVQLSVPQNISHSIGAQAVTSADLGRVMINITGPGINQPVFFVWDNKEGNNTPPPNFAIRDVPQGDGRLVQVLAIYKDQSTGQEIFYYGDILAPLKSDIVPLSITVFSFQGVTGEGQIGGRYLDAAGYGPTGTVRMFYTPPGKPRMLVHFSEIVGGWFNLFALKGQPFEYVLDNGVLLFGAPTALDSAHVATTGPDRLRIHVPNMYRSRDGGATREFQNAEEYIIGWFGPGGSGKNICYHSANSDISSDAYAASTGGALVQWTPGTANAANAYVIAGGVASASVDSENLCQISGTRFTDYISVDHHSLAYHDGSFAARGPFMMKDNGSYKSSLLATMPASTLLLDWEYLPGVLTDGAYKGIDGAEIYARTVPAGASGDIRENYRAGGGDGIDCRQLTQVQYPFYQVGDSPANPASPAVSMGITNPMLDASFKSAFDVGNAQVIVCAYQNTSLGKRYFHEVAMHHGNGGGGGGPMAYMTNNSATIGEAIGTYGVVVYMNPVPTSTVTVNYTTGTGTATPGSDYTGASGILTFASGVGSQTIYIPVNDDAAPESTETFQVNISPGSGAGIGTFGSMTVNITDNDSVTPSVQFAVATSNNVENTGGPHNVVVNLSNTSSNVVNVNYNVTGGTASGSSVDYTLGAGTVSFPAGQTTATISIPLVNDVISEPSETILISLSTPSNATLGSPNTHTVTINDDDTTPTVQFAAATGSNNENAGTIFVSVVLSNPSSSPITVNYAPYDGAATEGIAQDYSLAAGSITFAALETSKTIAVVFNDDIISEANEDFSVDLNSPVGATLGATATHTHTILDNDGLPDVYFATAVDSTNENTTPAVIVVYLSNPSSTAIAVNYSTANGTAIAPSDYSATAGTITFAAGQTSHSLSIVIVDDGTFEGNEHFTVNLSGISANADPGVPLTHTHTIIENEVPVADHLVFSTQPVSGPAGTYLIPVVELRDATNNILTSDNTSTITLSIQTDPSTGATLAGTKNLTVINGVASWSPGHAMYLDKVGTGFVLQASDGTRTVNSAIFNVTPAAANSLSWSTQPASGAAGTNLTPTVQILDVFGNVVTTDSTSTITLSIQTNPGGAVLAGDIDLTVTNGVATWTPAQAMYLNKVGTGYVLRASDGTRTQDSNAFNVTPGAAAALTWFTQPASVTAGTTLTPVVGITDAYGNILMNDNSSPITLTIQVNTGGATIGGTQTVVVSSGVANFAITINNPGSGYVLRATSGGLIMDSAPFNAN